jgi:hypothetical protein
MRILHLVSGGAVAVGLALSLAAPASAAPASAAPALAASAQVSEVIRYTAGQPAPTNTATASTLASWLGPCYPVRYTRSAGGWCDGNGPNWRYQGYVGCTDGREYWGPVRWAGDRRGSYGYCPTGAYANYGGVQAFYVG